jgi:hypothetical protein
VLGVSAYHLAARPLTSLATSLELLPAGWLRGRLGSDFQSAYLGGMVHPFEGGLSLIEGAVCNSGDAGFGLVFDLLGQFSQERVLAIRSRVRRKFCEKVPEEGCLAIGGELRNWSLICGTVASAYRGTRGATPLGSHGGWRTVPPMRFHERSSPNVGSRLWWRTTRTRIPVSTER